MVPEGGKDGGRAVIDTDRGESVLVYGWGGAQQQPWDWHDHTGTVAGRETLKAVG